MSSTRHVRYRRMVLVLVGTCVLLVILWRAATHLNWNPRYRVGQEIDRLNGVAVFYNGGVGHSSGRNLAPDGYNLGIKYQCVEFVKRYYYGRTPRRFSEPEPADSLRDKSNVIAGWLPSLTFALDLDRMRFAPKTILALLGLESPRTMTSRIQSRKILCLWT